MADGWSEFKVVAKPDDWSQFQKVNDATPPAKTPAAFTPSRAAGLDTRALIQGAAALPGMALNVPASIYNAGANLVQGYHAPDEANGPFRFRDQNQNVSKILDKTGLPKPETTGERLGGDVVSALSGTGASLGIASGLEALKAPVARAIGTALAANPGKQGVGAVTGGLAAGGGREAGLPVPIQIGLGVAGGAAPFAPQMATSLARGGPLTAAEQRATNAGYTLPPATMENPSTLSKLLGGWSGKIKTQQGASAKNQVLTNQIAASSLGLPRDTMLDDNVFHNLRQKAGTAYEDVKQSVPTTVADPAFIHDLGNISMASSPVAQEFPHLVKNDGITDLLSGFMNKPSFSTAAAVDAVKLLRARGTKNLQAIGNPEANDLGHAQRATANAIDDLLDRNVSQAGNPSLVNKYRAARQQIAKSHDVESATNTSTGEVNARRFGLLADKGKTLTGGLEVIGDVSNAFPKATQMPSKFGGAEPLSVLDIAAAAGAAGTGHYGLGAAALGRPLARSLVLSKAYQKAIRNQAPMGAAGLLPQQAIIDSSIFRNNQ